MARCFSYFIAYLLLYLSETYGEGSFYRPINRTDSKFVGRFPTAYPNLDHYSESEWDELIASKVNLPDFDSVQNNIKRRLEKCGLHLTGDFFETEIMRNTGTYTKIWLRNLIGIMNAVLTLYTLGQPLHNGNLFYPYFNEETRQVIEKQLSFKHYSYPLEYALMNRAFKERSVKIPIRVLYYGSNGYSEIRVKGQYRFNQFISTSRDMSFATRFLHSDSAVFIIENARAMTMIPYSQFHVEDEYIISPFQVFKVLNISQISHPTLIRVTYIRLRES